LLSAEPFEIKINQEILDDLSDRLASTRWPDELEGINWNQGANLDYMKELIDYWQNEYDWRRIEAELNKYSHFMAKIDDSHIHFIHEHGKGPDPTPIIITHGWPGSFFELYKLIPLLTDPGSYGGDPDTSFDVIIPSLPGYGFSDRPRKRGMGSLKHAAGLWAKLMTEELGYERFAAAGGDFGALVTQHLAESYPELLIGIHLTYIGVYFSTPQQSELSEAEKTYLQKIQQWTYSEGAYFMVHSTKPQSISYGLNDSPAGLAAWITEKFQTWTAKEELLGGISKDELLTNIMIYWVTQTISSSIRTYSEEMPGKLEPLPPVPAAFARFPEDINPPPREWVERRVNLKQWTEMPRGGHFAGLEEPELYADDIISFFRGVG